MLEKNILAANSIYVCTEHTKKDVDFYLNELSEVFKIVAKCENEELDVKSLLNTREAFKGFNRLN